MMIQLQKFLIISALLLLTCAKSLTINEPLKLLSTPWIQSFFSPYIDVSNHHIATMMFQYAKEPLNLLVNSNTFALDGKHLTNCSMSVPIKANFREFMHTGNLLSLGNNETLVVWWNYLEKNQRYRNYSVHLLIVNSTDCKYTYDLLEVSKREQCRYGELPLFVIPYISSFDVVFKYGDKFQKIQYGADGKIFRKEELDKSRSYTNYYILPVMKYSEPNKYVAFYTDISNKRNIVLFSLNADVLKRTALPDLSDDSDFTVRDMNFIDANYYKLVNCYEYKNNTRCKRFNIINWELEVSVEIKNEREQRNGKVHIFPDGRFLLVTVSAYGYGKKGENTDVFLTKVDADGQVEQTVKVVINCNVPHSNMYVYPYNDKVCLAYMCEGPYTDPLYTVPYTTEISCY